jgi:amino acid permease
VFSAILAFLSTIVGGGIVALPYAFYYAGIPFGIFLNFIVGICVTYSCYLYLYAKDLTGGLE